MQSPSTKRYLVGIFDSEVETLTATKELIAKNIRVDEVFSPYPIHGIDEVLGIKRSRLPIVCFIAGLIGFSIALFFQTWVFTDSWPMIVGGKPFNALPAFIPVTFELTVLIGGLTTVAAFLFRSKLFPMQSVSLIDPLLTDNHFVIAIEQRDASIDYTSVAARLKILGAIAVDEREVAA